MADITVTPADVELQGSANIDVKQAGETVTRGEAVYLKSDGKYWLADAAATTTAAVKGIALTSGVADQEIAVVLSGKIDLGATLTVGQVYVLSGNAGKIAPIGDTPSGEYLSILGVATAADELDVDIDNTGVAVA